MVHCGTSMPNCTKCNHECTTKTRRRTHCGVLRVFVAPWLGFPIRKEVRVDEGVDDSLVCGIDRFELNAHAHATIAPRDVPFRVDVALRTGHPETDFDLRAR